jgi:hypothetical protein
LKVVVVFVYSIPPKASDNTAAIVGASAATGIVLTLLIIGIVYLIRTKKICCDKFDKTDPYIDAIISKG